MSAPTFDPYVRQAEVLRVVDGDTIHARVDLGCDVKVDMTLRLLGIDAPEKGTVEGVRSREWLEDRLDTGDPVLIQTFKDRKEKFGRYLAVVWEGGDNINNELVAKGLAKPYNGGKR